MTVLTVALAACSATKRGNPKDVKFSGFLGDYSQLKPGTGDQADFIYIKPGLNLSRYQSVMIDPPQAWISEKQREKIGEKDLAYLLTSFDKAMRDTFAKKWTLVDRPSHDTVRVRIAISNASAATGALTPFTRILPWGMIGSEAVNVATGEYLNVGTITAEMEVVDGGTGERLGAGVDQRVGANSPVNVFSDWGDVLSGCTFWAERLSARLVEFGMKPSR